MNDKKLKPLAQLVGFNNPQMTPACSDCDAHLMFRMALPGREVMVDLQTVITCLIKARKEQPLAQLPDKWWWAVNDIYG